MKRFAVIPARGGSKRIPLKNIRPFLGKPMLAWPLESLSKSGLFDDVYVSTDSFEISEVASTFGAQVLQRPAELADDFTSSSEVVKRTIVDQIGETNVKTWVYMIYPTAPIEPDTIRSFVQFAESKTGYSLTVFRSSTPTQRALIVNPDGKAIPREKGALGTRTQDLEPTYFDAGKMYAGRVSDWLSNSGILASEPNPFLLPSWQAVDMDVEEDWLHAEHLFKLHSSKRHTED